jgi:hypothetical protein
MFFSKDEWSLFSNRDMVSSCFAQDTNTYSFQKEHSLIPNGVPLINGPNVYLFLVSQKDDDNDDRFVSYYEIAASNEKQAWKAVETTYPNYTIKITAEFIPGFSNEAYYEAFLRINKIDS